MVFSAHQCGFRRDRHVHLFLRDTFGNDRVDDTRLRVQQLVHVYFPCLMDEPLLSQHVALILLRVLELALVRPLQDLAFEVAVDTNLVALLSGVSLPVV